MNTILPFLDLPSLILDHPNDLTSSSHPLLPWPLQTWTTTRINYLFKKTLSFSITMIEPRSRVQKHAVQLTKVQQADWFTNETKIQQVFFGLFFVFLFVSCSPRVLPLTTIPEVGTVNVTNPDPDPDKTCTSTVKLAHAVKSPWWEIDWSACVHYLYFCILYFAHFVVPMEISPMGKLGRFPQGKPAATDCSTTQPWLIIKCMLGLFVFP